MTNRHNQKIKDVWFRSGLSLREIADRLGFEDLEEGLELRDRGQTRVLHQCAPM